MGAGFVRRNGVLLFYNPACQLEGKKTHIKANLVADKLANIVANSE